MRATVRVASLGIGVALALSACGDGAGGDSGDVSTINIQEYPGAFANIATWVAIDQGFCEDEGIKCATQEIASGPLGIQALANGDIQASIASSEVLMQAKAKGTPIKAVVNSHLNSIYSLTVSKDVEWQDYPGSMKELKGVAMGVTARGSGVEIMATALLDSAGMKASDVDFIPVGSPSTSFPAMQNGTIEASVVFEPFQTLCEETGACEVVVDMREGEGPAEMQALNGAFEPYAMTDKFLESNPKEAEAFIRAIEKSTAFLNDPKNVEANVKILKDHFTLGELESSDDMYTSLVENHVGKWGATIDRDAMTAFSDFLIKYEIIADPVTPDDFVFSKAPEPSN